MKTDRVRLFIVRRRRSIVLRGFLVHDGLCVILKEKAGKEKRSAIFQGYSLLFSFAHAYIDERKWAYTISANEALYSGDKMVVKIYDFLYIEKRRSCATV